MLDHSNASFSPTTNQTTQTINFGNVLKGSDYPQSELHDLQSGGEHRRGLHGEPEADRLLGNGDAALNTNLSTFNGLAAGVGNTYTAS